MEGGALFSNHGLNFRIFTIVVTFWSHFYESRVYVSNRLKTIHIHTVFFADAELLRHSLLTMAEAMP